MGICASCIRSRKSSETNREREPLLPLGGDSDPDGLTDSADNLSQIRQQEIAHIVQTTHDYFIDIPSVDTVDPEPVKDVSEFAERLKMGAEHIEFPNNC